MSAILFVKLRPAPDWEARFKTWCETEHIPDRMAVPGFLGAQRYHSVDDYGCLVLYEMADLDALRTPEFERLMVEPSDETKWMIRHLTTVSRFLGTEIGQMGEPDPAAKYLHCEAHDVAEGDSDVFAEWLSEERLPQMADSVGWSGARQYRLKASDPGRHTRLVIHYATGPKAPLMSGSGEGSPWRGSVLQMSFSRFGEAFRAERSRRRRMRGAS
ncbi:DUF4286 family protein [Salipiger abyssi]|uniref:Uncharacterized protein n=1 Tax=Salipiger abyssi TaxID=1250539 RepID=A0A1P8UMN5_9RHOB|nr:DUF4286 family protein [Salipiger abyssi]APZ50666.1 hypothetical protein Ga0080574_TMP332 [Salipiger abyssi]